MVLKHKSGCYLVSGEDPPHQVVEEGVEHGLPPYIELASINKTRLRPCDKETFLYTYGSVFCQIVLILKVYILLRRRPALHSSRGQVMYFVISITPRSSYNTHNFSYHGLLTKCGHSGCDGYVSILAQDNLFSVRPSAKKGNKKN